MEGMEAPTQTSIHPRVVRDLERLREVVNCSVPDVEAMILTGSFAHGEGSFLETAGESQPYNDYDVVVVAKVEPEAELCKSLGAQVAQQVGLRGVDLVGVGLHRFAWLPPSIFNYDFRHEGYVFHGDASLLDTLPNWEPADIPLIEAQVLLLNRMICLLESVEDGPNASEHDPRAVLFLAYQTAKAAFALADTVALLHGMYAICYQGKRDLLRSLLPVGCERVEVVEAAWRLRQNLDPAHLGIPAASFWQRTRGELLRTFLYLMNWMYACHRPFETPQELALFMANYNAAGDPRRAAIEAAQYVTLAAWNETQPDASMLSLARDLLSRAGITCAGNSWPLVRRAVVAAWFRYCH